MGIRSCCDFSTLIFAFCFFLFLLLGVFFLLSFSFLGTAFWYDTRDTQTDSFLSVLLEVVSPVGDVHGALRWSIVVSLLGMGLEGERLRRGLG